MLSGWAKSIQISSPLPGNRYPWYWTYAIFLEDRWKQISEISSMYGEEDGDGDEVEIPKAYWHDLRRVDAWIDKMKRKRKDKMENPQ